MSSAAVTKNMRLLLAACVVLVIFNLAYFFNQGLVVTLESLQASADSVEPPQDAAPAINNDKPAAKKPQKGQEKVRLRKYFDDRDNGLLVVAQSRGVVDKDDFETADLERLYEAQKSNKDEKKFEIIEIRDYDYLALMSEAQLKLLDDARKVSTFKEHFTKFMSDLMLKIADAKPDCGNINTDAHYAESKLEKKHDNREGRIPVYGGHYRELYTKEPVRTRLYLLYFLRLDPKEVSALQDSHLKFVDLMPLLFPSELYDSGEDLDFMTGDGIVYLGGGKYNQLVLLSISLLRASGSKLPIEVILPKRDDFDIDLCNTILPMYNGRCKIMEDYLPESLMKDVRGFQLKNVALLVSSFRNVLYLDADNIPAANPDLLFVNEPFRSKRMIMWPDLWRRSTSPAFYEVAGIDYDEKWRMRNSYFPGDDRGKDANIISFHDCKGTIPEASSETGQMMIDKEKHFKSLVLAMYYNFYGPDYYYPLLSQGAAGEGDKETFIAAAHKLSLPYYQVSEFNREFGPEREDKKHEFFGMGQYNPIIDYIQSKKEDSLNKPGEYAESNKDLSKNNYGFHYYKSFSLMFLHANWPKFYISEMFEKNSHGRGPVNLEGKRRRLYTDFIKKETHKYDLEVEIMRHVKHWFCNYKVQLQDVPGPDSEGRNKICLNVQEQIQYLQG